MTTKKQQLGEVWQLALPDGRFAYARVLRESVLAFYRTMTNEAGCPPIGSRDFQFVVGFYTADFVHPEVRMVGTDPMDVDEDGWGPLEKVVDPITGRIKVYDHGVIRPATPEDGDLEALEAAGVWGIEDVVGRLMGTWRPTPLGPPKPRGLDSNGPH